MLSNIQHIQDLIAESGRKVWRFGDMQFWPTFKANSLLSLSLLKGAINYHTADLNQLKRGKRVIPRWVHQLHRSDIIFLLDKHHYYGIAIARLEYHRANPSILLGKGKPKPAIRVDFVHALAEPFAHSMKIAGIRPDSFAPINQSGFSLTNTFALLAQHFPEVLVQLLDVLTSDQKKAIVHNQALAPEKLEAIQEKYPNPNIILYGPPGTGKTYQSIDIAVEMIGQQGANHAANHQLFKQHLGLQIEMITLHPNYTYEDFVQGLRPVSNKNKTLQFELQDGIFKRIAQRASINYLQSKTKRSPFDRKLLAALQEASVKNGDGNTRAYAASKSLSAAMLNEGSVSYGGKRGGVKKTHSKELQNYVLIIDEINRANLSSILGELITLLEKDKRYDAANELLLTLPSGEAFVLPPNLYIIGTMNTTDKTIAFIDMALRRRFDFVPCYPRYDIPQLAQVDTLRKMNQKITQLRNRDFQIGHAYFMKNEVGNFDLNYQLQHRIIPLLQEYFRQDLAAIKSVLDAANIEYTVNDMGDIEVGG